MDFSNSSSDDIIISSGQSSGEELGDESFLLVFVKLLNLNFLGLFVAEFPSSLESETDDLSLGNISLEGVESGDLTGLSGTKKFGMRGPVKEKNCLLEILLQKVNLNR